MTGSELRALRTARGLTQSHLADFLGDTTYGSISRWEKDKAPIPQWAAEKLLASTTITLPLTELERLLQLATKRKITFAELPRDAILSYIQGNEPSASTRTPVNYRNTPPPSRSHLNDTADTTDTTD